MIAGKNRKFSILRVVMSREGYCIKFSTGGRISKYVIQVIKEGQPGFERALNPGEIEHRINVEELKASIADKGLTFSAKTTIG